MEPQPTEPIQTVNAKKTVRPPSKAGIVAWSAIGLLLITWLCLFLILGFFWEKNKNKLVHDETYLTHIQEQLSQNRASNETLQEKVTQIQNFIQQKFSSNDNAVYLDKVNQLIHLAHYNLIYLHDTDSALTALILADQQLAEIISPDIQLNNLRHLVANDITALKALPNLDLASHLALLNTLQTQISQLPLLLTKKLIEKPKTLTTVTEKKWVNALQENINSLRQLITIRHLNKPMEPLLPEMEQYYLQHNLQLLLQQAQWALLHHQPSLYQSSLEQVQEAIPRYFATNAPVTQTVMQAIHTLEKVNLTATLPDLAPALQLLSSIINDQSASTSHQKESS